MSEGEVKESLGVIVEQARRIAEVVKRLGDIERQQRALSVQYLNEARMLDLRTEGGPAAPGKAR
jgi:hypothetical protein